MKNFENTIEMLKKIGEQNAITSTMNLAQYAELIEAACVEYGRENVFAALSTVNK